jgi:hypothetical protein
MEFPILPSDQLRSTVAIPSGLNIPSDVLGQKPLLQYVAGLVPINPGQYAGPTLRASQESTQNEISEYRASTYDRDQIPAIYRAIPGVDVCIWCNSKLNADNQGRKICCQGVSRAGHEIYKHVKGDETFCPDCKIGIDA